MQDHSIKSGSHIYRVTPTFSNFIVSRDIISHCLKKHIRVGKASGPDNIRGKEIELLGEAFIDSFYQIANRSINDCKFPNQWKIARVNCIHKKGNTLDCGNYRSISLLSIPSRKLLESVVCSQLDSFLHDFKLTTDSQWGFTKGKSIELLLLNMNENWRSALNQGKSIGIIFIDFQKAFDCVSHQILPQKLQASGICNEAYKWIIDYLSNRQQFVSINGTNSENMRITSGVPQGSLLGPRLFSIFTNDLPNHLDCNIEMFADDSTAYFIGNSIDSIHVQIQKLLDNVHYWSKSNSMFIHPTKTEAMFLSKTPFIGPLRPITYESKLINYVSRSSCLGVTLDNKLSWSPHINQIPCTFNA